MPIKFRCEYCRQLMGIAESKAGSLVDCPTCGRTLRVPNRDGTVEPPPKAGVNLADDGLRRALDELAQMGQTGPAQSLPVEQRPTPARSTPVLNPDATQDVTHQPNEVVTRDVLPGQHQNSIALEPLPPMKVVDPPAHARPAVSSTHLATPASRTDSAPERVLAEISGRPGPIRPVVSKVPLVPPQQDVSLSWLIAACAISLLAGAIGGFVVGRNMIAPQKPQAPQGEAPAVAAPAIGQPPLGQPQIKGRLTYRNSAKQMQPDAGACVVILPVKRADRQKLPTVGFRPNDDDAARQAAAKLMEEQGGRLAVADADGNFQIEIPEPGDYHIIALSHFQGRPEDDSGLADGLKTLAVLFDRPAQLVGKLAFHVATIEHKGAEDVTWDYAFSGE